MREKWTDELVERRVLEACAALGLNRMPTASELARHTGGHGLNGRIVRSGGFDALASRLNLEVAYHSSRRGWMWEGYFAGLAGGRGLRVVRSERVKSHYDMLVNGRKVDVKSAAGSIIKGGIQWTFRIATDYRCEFYAMVAHYPKQPPRVFIVPDAEVPWTCATIRQGPNGSKYDKWENAWTQL